MNFNFYIFTYLDDKGKFTVHRVFPFFFFTALFIIKSRKGNIWPKIGFLM